MATYTSTRTATMSMTRAADTGIENVDVLITGLHRAPPIPSPPNGDGYFQQDVPPGADHRRCGREHVPGPLLGCPSSSMTSTTRVSDPTVKVVCAGQTARDNTGYVTGATTGHGRWHHLRRRRRRRASTTPSVDTPLEGVGVDGQRFPPAASTTSPRTPAATTAPPSPRGGQLSLSIRAVCPAGATLTIDGP